MKIYGPRDSDYGPAGEHTYEYEVGDAVVTQDEKGALKCIECSFALERRTFFKRTGNPRSVSTCKHCNALRRFLSKPLDHSK